VSRVFGSVFAFRQPEIPENRLGDFWRRAWEHVIPFFAFPPEVRRVIYTTNVIESLHMQLRKIIKNRGHFPNDEAATKLLWLALRNVLSKAVSVNRRESGRSR
jgi:transposase-like protein